jgi:hypothetical protein
LRVIWSDDAICGIIPLDVGDTCNVGRQTGDFMNLRDPRTVLSKQGILLDRSGMLYIWYFGVRDSTSIRVAPGVFIGPSDVFGSKK